VPPGEASAELEKRAPAIPVSGEAGPERARRELTPALLDALEPVAARLAHAVGPTKDVASIRQTFAAFSISDEERKELSLLGFKTLTLHVSAGGGKILGVEGGQALAISIIDDRVEGRWLTTGGVTLGTSIGGGAGVSVGLWKNPVDKMAGWSWGANVSVRLSKGAATASVAWGFEKPSPRFQGFTLGYGTPPAKFASVDAALGAFEYTGQIVNFASDTGRFLAGKPTAHGAKIGEGCKVGPDCKGYLGPIGTKKTGTACCGGVCKMTKKDWAGVSYCPAQCVGTMFGRAGTC
jgi:hypothetical protein